MAFTKFHMSKEKLTSVNVSYLDYSTGVDRNHGTNPAERWVLFLIVSYVSQRGAPNKLESKT